jgi:hypothetical protein
VQRRRALGARHRPHLTAIGFAYPHKFPATHQDSNGATLKYGLRIVLRPDFTIPTGATIAQKNILTALQTYGAFIADKGSGTFDFDAVSPLDPGGLITASGGLNSNVLSSNLNGVNVTAGDFRAAPSNP